MPLALCERDADGGGPGGGPGRGIPGSQPLGLDGDLLSDWLDVLEERTEVPIPPADAARFDAGGSYVEELGRSSGGCCGASTVVPCRLSTVFTEVDPEVCRALLASVEKLKGLLSVRCRGLALEGGGGGGKADCAVPPVELDWATETGLGRGGPLASKRSERPPVARLTGVVDCGVA